MYALFTVYFRFLSPNEGSSQFSCQGEESLVPLNSFSAPGSQFRLQQDGSLQVHPNT